MPIRPPPLPADPWDIEIPNSERLEQVYRKVKYIATA